MLYDVKKIGLIQAPDLKKHNDYVMWILALSKTNAYRQPECLSYYIKHDSSISSGSKFRLIKHFYTMWHLGLGKSAFVSFCLTVNNVFHGFLKKIIYKKTIKE